MKGERRGAGEVRKVGEVREVSAGVTGEVRGTAGSTGGGRWGEVERSGEEEIGRAHV